MTKGQPDRKSLKTNSPDMSEVCSCCGMMSIVACKNTGCTPCVTPRTRTSRMHVFTCVRVSVLVRVWGSHDRSIHFSVGLCLWNNSAIHPRLSFFPPAAHDSYLVLPMAVLSKKHPNLTLQAKPVMRQWVRHSSECCGFHIMILCSWRHLSIASVVKSWGTSTSTRASTTNHRRI